MRTGRSRRTEKEQGNWNEPENLKAQKNWKKQENLREQENWKDQDE